MDCAHPLNYRMRIGPLTQCAGCETYFNADGAVVDITVAPAKKAKKKRKFVRPNTDEE